MAQETLKEISSYAERTIHHKAKKMIGRNGFTVSDLDDLKQELTIDLIQRLKNYDSQKSKINTFISRIVDRKISKLIRFQCAQMRDYRSQTCSVNDRIGDGNGNQVERSETISADEQDDRSGRYSRVESERNDLALDLMSVISSLPEDLQKPAELLMQFPVTEVAQMLNVPRTTFYGIIERLRLLFADKGLCAYL